MVFLSQEELIDSSLRIVPGLYTFYNIPEDCHQLAIYAK